VLTGPKAKASCPSSSTGVLRKCSISGRVALGTCTPALSQVGSRTGARMHSDRGSECCNHVSSSRHVERSVRLSRTMLSCLLLVQVYGTYHAEDTFGERKLVPAQPRSINSYRVLQSFRCIVGCLAATIEPDRGHRLEMCEIYVTSSSEIDADWATGKIYLSMKHRKPSTQQK